MSAHNLDQFLDSIRNDHPDLTHLSLEKELKKHGTPDIMSNFGAFVEALSSNTTITCLDGSRIIDNNLLIQLAPLLSSNTTLTSLILDNCDIMDYSIWYLLSMLMENKSLTHLSLNYSKMTSESCHNIGKLLSHNQSLKHLSLEGNSISCADVQNMIPPSFNLSHLNLNYNHIKDSGATHLSKVLSTNPNLQMLLLRKNLIAQTGGTNIAKSLQENTGLRVLDMSGNKMGDYAICELSASNLEYLGLSDVGITRKSVTYLCELITRPECRLKHLDLWGNPLGNTGLSEIVEAISRSRISEMDLATIKINISQLNRCRISRLSWYKQTKKLQSYLQSNKDK